MNHSLKQPGAGEQPAPFSCEYSSLTGLYNSPSFLIAGTTFQCLDRNYAYHTAVNEDEKARVRLSRAKLLTETGFSALVSLNQVHGDNIHSIDRTNLGLYLENHLIEGDGLITTVPGLLLGILTADCLPVYYFNDSGTRCALVHAGWKGIEKGIHLKMLALFRENAGETPESLNIIIGPYIQQCCYEVGVEMADKMDVRFISRKESRYYLDLGAWLTEGLVKAGARKERIQNSGLCTKCSSSPLFYSYRNNHQTERNLSFIGIRSNINSSRPH